MPIFLTLWFGKTRRREHNFPNNFLLFSPAPGVKVWTDGRASGVVCGSRVGTDGGRWSEDNKGPQTKGECKIKQFCRVNRDLTFCQQKFLRTRTVVLCNPFSKTVARRVGELYIFKINYSGRKECVLLGNSIKVFSTLFPRTVENLLRINL